MFLALGSQLSLGINRLSKNQFYGILIGIITSFYLTHTAVKEQLSSPFLGMPALFGIGGAMAITISHYKKIGCALLTLALLMINLFESNAQGGLSYGGSRQQKEFLLTITKGAKTVQKTNRKGDLLFWYDIKEPLWPFFRSIASIYLWQYRLLNEEFPKVNTQINCQQISDQKMVCILSERPNVIEAANRNLAHLGLQGVIEKEETIGEGSQSFKMTFIKVYPLSTTLHETTGTTRAQKEDHP
jgi:hypothetical protein